MSIASEVEIPTALFLKARQVRARYGDVSHMWLVRRQKDAGFPSPIFFGGIRFWKLSDLERWEADQQAKAVADCRIHCAQVAAGGLIPP